MNFTQNFNYLYLTKFYVTIAETNEANVDNDRTEVWSSDDEYEGVDNNDDNINY